MEALLDHKIHSFRRPAPCLRAHTQPERQEHTQQQDRKGGVDMGRKPCDAADNFKTPVNVGMSRKGHLCSHCEMAKMYGVGESLIAANRKETMENHLANCLHTPDDIRQTFIEVVQDRSKNGKRPAEDKAESATNKKPNIPLWTTTVLFAYLIHFQHDNLLPDTFIQKASTKRLFQLMCPGIKLPSRRKLGNTLLHKYANDCKAKGNLQLEDLVRKSKGRVNLLSDVLMNVSKLHLLGSQLSLFVKAIVFKVEPVGDTHDGPANARLLDSLFHQSAAAGFDVGAVVRTTQGNVRKPERFSVLAGRRSSFSSASRTM